LLEYQEREEQQRRMAGEERAMEEVEKAKRRALQLKEIEDLKAR
jgi:hypothetical protein